MARQAGQVGGWWQAGLAALVAAALVVAGAAARAADDAHSLNVYNWSDYIDEQVLRDFEKESGIHVTYDTYDGNEVLYARLRAGHSGYDLVGPSAHWARRLIETRALQRLDRGRISTWGQLDPWVLEQTAASSGDKGNDFLVPWLWGITTVGINEGKVRAALGGLPMPADPWDLIFKPEYASRVKSCGLSLLDGPDDVFPAALLYLGRSGFSHERADYEAAARLLDTVRPYVTLFSSSSYINGLADGSLCVVLGWNGDIGIAAQRARAARTGQKILPLLSPRGSYMYVDTLALTADARHLDNAYRFLSFMFRPEIQARIVNRTVHGNPVRGADRLVEPAVRATPGIFLAGNERRQLRPQEPIPEEMLRLRTRLFTVFKSGG
jgi:putrescine transport system substrate-binding protein